MLTRSRRTCCDLHRSNLWMVNCLLPGGLVTEFLLSSWIDHHGTISLVESDVMVRLFNQRYGWASWFQRYVQTSWKSRLRWRRYGGLIFYHDLLSRRCGRNSILLRLVLPTLRSYLYSIATCRNLYQLLFDQYSCCCIIEKVHCCFIVCSDSPLRPNRARNYIE